MNKETQQLVDALRMLLGKISPDVAAIERGLADNQVTELAAVLPVHSHYDHAMDAPEVALRTGALLLGSQSTANIARGWGLPEAQIQVLQDRQPVRVGQFVITPIESRHFEFPDPAIRERALGETEIALPLVPPARVFDYRVGKAYVLHARRMCCMQSLRHGVFFDKVRLLCPFRKVRAREKMFYQLRLVLALEHILSRTTPRRPRPS